MSEDFQVMEAEVLLSNPDDVNLVCHMLVERGFTVDVLDWVDDESPATWIKARIITNEDQEQFFDRVKSIVEPRGEIVEGGRLKDERGFLTWSGLRTPDAK